MDKRDYIAQLIDRFFDGSTSPAEEQEIYRWYGEVADAGDLERYRAMFGWYEELPRRAEAAVAVEKPVRRRSFVRRYAAAAGVAALVAFAVCLVFVAGRQHSEAMDQLYAQYKGSYVVEDGRRITDIGKIYSRLQEAEAFADSLDSMGEVSAETYESEAIESMLSQIPDTAVARLLKDEIFLR